MPSDLVAVARIIDAWGIRGAVKIAPYASDGEAALLVRQWWIERGGQWESIEVLAAKTHGEAITATLVGYTSRNLAERLKGTEVWIARSRFPDLGDDEYYWVDLIGLNVVDLRGVSLGRVNAMMDNGAHAILEVEKYQGSDAPESIGRPVLIPFVERYIKRVDREQRIIVVEWGPEYEG